MRAVLDARRPHRRLVAAAVLALAGCGATETGLLVVVRSDLEVPAALTVLRATVLSSAGEPVSRNDFVLDGPARLPLSFAVEPRDPDRGEGGVTIVVEGRDPQRTLVIEQRATVAFVPERRPLLPMFLGRDCAAVSCLAIETCDRGACRSATLDASALAEVEAGEELTR